MKFTEIDKLKALAIVHIFETSNPLGDYGACAVLNDGAGLSYGINQFTHRSGSLKAVVDLYLQNGGQIGRRAIEENLPLLRSNLAGAIRMLAANRRFAEALQAAATTREMRSAQNQIAFEKYLKPAIQACEGSNFILPLSVAVVYDSINHGSWEKIRDRVRIGDAARQGRGDAVFEKAWITDYLKKRHAWLSGIPRLRVTTYRTGFFLEQVALGNWFLDPPLNVHGVTLNDDSFRKATVCAVAADHDSAVEHHLTSAVSTESQPGSSLIGCPLPRTAPTEAQPSIIRNDDRKIVSESRVPNDGYLDCIEEKVNEAAAKYDQAEAIVLTVVKRTDAAKSLWTAVVGTLWQSLWAVGSFAAGLPKDVWLMVAFVAAMLMLLYLYRQIALGKIRERAAVSAPLGSIGQDAN